MEQGFWKLNEVDMTLNKDKCELNCVQISDLGYKSTMKEYHTMRD